MTKPVRWRKSSYSGNNGQCVEVGATDQPTEVRVRDSKSPNTGTLAVSVADFSAFVDSLKR